MEGKVSAGNRAVFMTGWQRGLSTVTSNRVVVVFIERAVREGAEAGEVEEGMKGPDCWVVGGVRSLAGKGRRGVEDGKRGGEE